jgi:hypothetical protein
MHKGRCQRLMWAQEYMIAVVEECSLEPLRVSVTGSGDGWMVGVEWGVGAGIPNRRNACVCMHAATGQLRVAHISISVQACSGGRALFGPTATEYVLLVNRVSVRAWLRMHQESGQRLMWAHIRGA